MGLFERLVAKAKYLTTCTDRANFWTTENWVFTSWQLKTLTPLQGT